MSSDPSRYRYRAEWSEERERWESSVDELPYLRCVSYDSPGDAIGKLCEILAGIHTQQLVLDAARNFCRLAFNYSPDNYNKGQEGMERHIEFDAESYLEPEALVSWLKELVEAAVVLRKPLNPPIEPENRIRYKE